MTTNSPEVRDFTDLTCTNLMIRMKILLQSLTAEETLVFYATREQVDTTCSLMSVRGYRITWSKEDQNRYIVSITK